MGKPIRILGINASPFRKGNVAQMLLTALKAAEQTGATTRIIHLGDIPHDDGRREEKTYPLKERIAHLPRRGNLQGVVEAILAAHGVIFATPTRHFTTSSCMSALLSWLQVTTDAPDYALAGKVAAFMAGCEEDGGQSAIEKMMSPCVHMGMIVPPFANYFFNKNMAKGASEGDWQETDRILTGLNVRRMIQILRGEISGQRTAKDWNNSEIGSW